MQEFEQLEVTLDTASARKDELDAEIAALSASGRDYEALLAATEQLAQVAMQVFSTRPLALAACLQMTSMSQFKHSPLPVLRSIEGTGKQKSCMVKANRE